MKKHIFTLLIISVFSGASAQGTYHPITEGCLWSVSNEKYMTAGDTVLGGKAYLKLYRQVGGQPFDFDLNSAEYFAAIRNDSAGKKVYAYLPAGTWVRDLVNYSEIRTDTAMEVLIYDFSLKMGDTVTYYVIGDEVAKSIAVHTETANIFVGWSDNSIVDHQFEEADTLVAFSDGSTRSRIFLRGISYYPQDHVWLEGVGSVRGFNEGPQLSLSDYGLRILLCYEDGSGAAFQTEFDFDNDTGDCFNNGFGGGVTEKTINPVSACPNPTDGLLHIELSGAGIANVALYDLQGRIVVTNNESPQQGTAMMNLQNVPAGVYLLRVTDTDGNEHHRKIVKR